MKPVVLSKRMRAIAGMVTTASRVCDVGCDHGFISIWLAEQGISPKVLAMDVRSGPLDAAKKHIAERGLDTCIETRISDGLHNYNIGEADTLICAGMGGGLMLRILSEAPDKTASFQELILQPQSEIEAFRAGLRNLGYQITDEQMVEEDGKFYPMMQAKSGLCKPMTLCKPMALCKLQDRYGPILLEKKDRTLAAYLQREERIYGEILQKLQAEGLSDVKRKRRYAEVSRLLEECRMAQQIVAQDRQ